MSRSLAPTVLVPGAGGAAAIGAIRWLRRSGFRGRIVSTDSDVLSAGFAFSDASHVVGNITEPGAYAHMLDILSREKVEVMLPTSPTYCAVCSNKKDDLAALGVVLPAADSEVVRICQDKLSFHSAVSGSFPIPEMIMMGTNGPQKYPCFVKPRWGSGSQGAGPCLDCHDWLFYSKFPKPLLAQELLKGSEYSVDVLSDLDGEAKLAVVRQRLTISDGVSTRVRIVRDEEIESLCISLARYLQLKGVSCMQLKRDACGRPRFLEVNAHLGGTSIASILAGVDLVRMLLAVAFREDFAIPPPKEITVVRHFDEVIV